MYVVDLRRKTGADVTRMMFPSSLCLLLVYMERAKQMNQTLDITLLRCGMAIWVVVWGCNGSTTTTTTIMIRMVVQRNDRLR
jgi:hypothetical protein